MTDFVCWQASLRSPARPWLTPAHAFSPRRDLAMWHASKVKEFYRTSFDVEHSLSVRGVTVVEGRETRVWTRRDANDAAVVRSEPVPAAIIARFSKE
jgi:hypothetical protein